MNQEVQIRPLVLGIQEHQEDQYHPSDQSGLADQENLGILSLQYLLSAQGNLAGQELQEYPSLPSLRHFL